MLQLFANQHNIVHAAPTPTTTSSLLNQLPVPLLLQMNNNWQARSDGQLISSVVATPNKQINRSGGRSDRHNGGVGQSSPTPRLSRRQLANLNTDRWPPQQPQPPPPDILVRLVGHWHAKCALQYLLCYLLSSSVTVLVCLRLFRLCNSSRDRLHSGRQTVAAAISCAAADPASYGFYYRTRLGGLIFTRLPSFLCSLS